MDNGFVAEIQQQAELRGWGFQTQSCRHAMLRLETPDRKSVV